MLCDTNYDRLILTIFNEVLEVISDTCAQYDVHQLIVGGDFNTDFHRTTSLHTNTLKLFLESEVRKSGLAHVMSDVDYTYLSKINNVRSIVDHFSVFTDR